ncbi:MAG TPA: hypothetical protein VFY21_00715 [Xanthobacteraceae bacterium]|nr:hypothetical protein [Xanthobacteraceae bacterium]
MMGNPTGRTLAAYLAGITVLAGLMYVVALGGSSITAIDSRAQLSSTLR